jgi:Lon-like protease
VQIATAVDEFVVPFEVALAPDVRIGGPSAGLMVAITIYDLLSEEDLLAGRTVMGTGSLDADGRVGPVGGVPEKMVAAADHGADLVFVPALQLEDALSDRAGRPRVIGVDTFEEALEALRRPPCERSPGVRAPGQPAGAPVLLLAVARAAAQRAR